MYIKEFICVDDHSNINAAIIGAIVGVDCTVIIIMVITNIMVWIYCFRRRDHTGIHTYLLVNGIQFIIVSSVCIIYVGTSSDLHRPTKDIVNPAYHNVTDDHFKKPVEKPISYYEEVNISSDVKMTPNPAYAVP